MMQMENMKRYRILMISMFFILLVFGICMGFTLTKKDKKNTEPSLVVDNKIEEDTEEVNVYTATSTKTYDIEVVYEDYYKLCGESIIAKDMVYGTTLDKVKEEEAAKQKTEEKVYEIEEESNDRIVYKRTLEGNCPNHFKVILENGIIVVYSVLNETMSTVFQEIDTSQDLIRPEMLEELNNGIIVNSKEELNLLIEDIES